MNKTLGALIVLIFFISCIVTVLPTRAETRKIIVPDDYLTISMAIKNANDGDVIVVKKGIYEETTLEINKSISLIGEDAASTIISLHPAWVPTGGYHLANGGIEPDYGYDNPIKISANNVTFLGFAVFNNASSHILVTGSGIQIIGNYFTTSIFLLNSGQEITRNIVRGELLCVGSNKTIANNILNSIWNMASEVTITGNIISGSYGIAIGAWGNTVFNNTIENSEVALTFWAAASGNKIYHNNFINNTELMHTWELTNQTVGLWDDGYPNGGNYWGNYLFKYPNATEIGSSGIGDTPYVIDGYNQDNYPLISPINISNDLSSLIPLPTFNPTPVATVSPLPVSSQDTANSSAQQSPVTQLINHESPLITPTVIVLTTLGSSIAIVCIIIYFKKRTFRF